jgi:hypothetical protein
MNERVIRVFEKLSGWTEKSHYEHEHDGYITIEEDIMTGEAHAFLWSHEVHGGGIPKHLQYLHMGDHVFVKP